MSYDCSAFNFIRILQKFSKDDHACFHQQCVDIPLFLILPTFVAINLLNLKSFQLMYVFAISCSIVFDSL